MRKIGPFNDMNFVPNLSENDEICFHYQIDDGVEVIISGVARVRHLGHRPHPINLYPQNIHYYNIMVRICRPNYTSAYNEINQWLY